MPKAAAIVLLCWLLLSPAWMFLVLLAGNGLDTRAGGWLLGGVGAMLLCALVAAPWLTLRCGRRWQSRWPPLPAAVAAALLVTGAWLFALALLTFFLLGTLSG